MSDTVEHVSACEAAAMLGAGVDARHVQARVLRGTLDGTRRTAGDWEVSIASIERALHDAPECGACSNRATAYVIVKYPHHDRVQFSLCNDHAAKTAVSYGRHGHVLEVDCQVGVAGHVDGDENLFNRYFETIRGM